MEINLNDLNKIYDFVIKTESLKNELRHSWTSSGRQESVAEHCWRLSLMVVLMLPYLNKQLDSEKLIKLAILHDLSEILAEDVSYHITERNKKTKDQRHKVECFAMNRLVSALPEVLGNEIKNLWLEFENLESEEACIVRSLDKIEVCMQHNSASPTTWSKEERESIEPFSSYLDELPSSLTPIKLLKKLALEKTSVVLKAIRT